MLKGLIKATVPVVKLGVKVGLCGGAVYVTKEVAAILRILFQNSSIFTFRPLSVRCHNCDMSIYANIY